MANLPIATLSYRGAGLSCEPRKLFAVFSAVLVLAAVSQASTKKTAKSSVATVHSVKSTGKSGKSNHKTGKRASKRSRRAKKVSWRNKGQHKPDAERTREIQSALIRQNYLQGAPSGTWDQRTRDAMTRYQEDHGWQTKMVPDSRALIELGLGPRNDNLINPESAMTSRPQTVGGGAEHETSSTPASLPQ